MIFAEKLGQLRMKLIGVACTNPKAVGYRYAQEKGIYTTRDYSDLYKLKGLNMIIELTGREEVANEIFQTKPYHVRVMDHVAARVFWDVFKIEEERIAERRRATETVRESEEKYKTLIESSLTGIFIHQDGKYVFVNHIYDGALFGTSSQYPIAATTYRLTEHWHTGSMTRNLPWCNELQPEPFVEISEELADIKGISNGDMVTVSCARGSIDVKACVTKRFKPFQLNGQRVHQVGVIWHWGYATLNPGPSGNILTPFVGDANTRIQESKAFLVEIEKL